MVVLVLLMITGAAVIRMVCFFLMFMLVFVLGLGLHICALQSASSSRRQTEKCECIGKLRLAFRQRL